jgi:hypothetical protein
LTWKFSKVGDEEKLPEAIKQLTAELIKEKVPKDEIDEDTITYAYFIETINGVELSLIEKYLYLSEVLSPAEYIKFLSQIVTTFDFGVDPNIKTTCTKCGGPVEMPVMFSGEFFFPEYRIK